MKKIILSGISTILICISLLFLVSLIPQKAIVSKSRESAEFFCEHELFDRVTDRSFLSRQDNYADCILLNIIYCIDREDLLKSCISCEYYNPADEAVDTAYSNITNMDFDSRAREDMVDYSRYWHGSMVILRPMLTLFSVSQIRMILGGIYLGLSLVFCILLIRDGHRNAAITYILGMIMTSQWMLAFCLEYVMTFLVLSVQMPAMYLLIKRKRDKKEREHILYRVVCVGGIVTAFVDFLTTETITCLVPLMIYLILEWEKQNEKEGFTDKLCVVVKTGLCWGISYAFMFSLKWIIAMCVLGKDAFLTALKEVSLRMNGEATYGNVLGAANVPVISRIYGAIWRNLGCLFPFGDSMGPGKSMLYAFVALFAVFAVWYLFHKKVTQADKISIYIILLVGLIPYIRFLVINNHSYIHFFFTFRSQFATIIGIMYIALHDLLENVFHIKKELR